MKKLIWAIALLLLAAGAGWWFTRPGADPAPGEVAVAPAAASLLEYIPADAPYALAALQPLPADVADAMWTQAETSIAVWPQMLANLREELADKGDEGSQAALKLMDALEAEFRGKTARESAEHLGLPRVGVGAVYGIGPMPVARLQLADAARLEGFIERLQTAAGFSLARKTLDEAVYWTLPEDMGEAPMQPIVAVVGQQLVLTVHPRSGGDALLRSLLGLDRPAASQADGGELARRARAYDLLPYAIGYVDSLRLFRQMTDTQRPDTAALWAAMDQPVPEFDANCRSEIESMAAHWPGATLGMTRFDAGGNAVRSILHLSAELSAELQKLRSPMPGGDPQGSSAIVSFGMAMSLQALPGVVSRLAGRISNAPYTCDALQPLNQMATDAAKGINNPALFAAAPMINGFAVSIDRFAIPADRPEQPDVDGTVVIGSDNAASLVGMAKSFVPQLAQLEVPADGTPVTLPELPGSPPGMPPVKVAQTEGLLALVSGGSTDRLKARLTRDESFQPLLAVQVRPQLYELISDTLEQAAADMPDGPGKTQMLVQARMMREAHAKAFSQAHFTLSFTELGVEMLQGMESP